MPQRDIIVGVDFCEPSLVAVRWTAHHLARNRPLVLAHAVYAPQPPSFLRGMYPPADELIEAARRGAEVRLRELADTLGSAQVEVVVASGRPDEVLAGEAEDRKAELVVIGAHGARPGVWKLLGSTAERVVRRAPTSVLLARGLGPRAPERVLVALDESEQRHAVEAWAARFTHDFGSEVIVMHVVNPISHGAVVIAASAAERRKAEEQMRTRAEEWLRVQLSDGDIGSAATHVAFGDAGFEILSAIKRFDADLVIVGRHGAGGTSGAFMGSVPEFLLRNGSGSVLTVSE
jgi:nucleotide-binding universal stress UspA family protein